MSDGIAEQDHKPRRAKIRPLEELHETGVSVETAVVLHAALCRLVDGTHDPRRTRGRLGVTDLADEAEVGRATTYRAGAILAEMRRIKAEIDSFRSIPRNPALRAEQLERQVTALKQKHARRERQLQSSIDRLGNRVNALEIKVQHLQALLDARTTDTPPKIREM